MSPDEIEAKVALMRRLGVLEVDGIKLGPEPPPPPPPAPEPLSRDAQIDASLDRLLGSSGLIASEDFRKRWKRATAGVNEDVA